MRSEWVSKSFRNALLWTQVTGLKRANDKICAQEEIAVFKIKNLYRPQEHRNRCQNKDRACVIKVGYRMRFGISRCIRNLTREWTFISPLHLTFSFPPLTFWGCQEMSLSFLICEESDFFLVSTFEFIKDQCHLQQGKGHCHTQAFSDLYCKDLAPAFFSPLQLNSLKKETRGVEVGG